jgi:drug/metabolite transporter (DMT)-like permease
VNVTHSIPYIGELAAITSALIWAFASILFERLGKTIRPIEMNLLKGVLAFLFLGATSLILGEKLAALTPLMLVYLIISGVVGIGFGDTAYFAALNDLGTRITLLCCVLAPPMTAGVAYLLLGETLKPNAWIGILITLAGVAWVITEQTGGENPAARKHLWRGLIWAVLANLAQAVGAVISRMTLTQSSITALQTGVIRLAAGSVSILIWMAIRREPIGRWIKTGTSPKLWRDILMAVTFGSCMAIWMQQVALQNTEAGIAQTLLSTSPIFILPIAALRGEKVSLRAVFGAIASMVGVALLFGII